MTLKRIRNRKAGRSDGLKAEMFSELEWILRGDFGNFLICFGKKEEYHQIGV